MMTDADGRRGTVRRFVAAAVLEVGIRPPDAVEGLLAHAKQGTRLGAGRHGHGVAVRGSGGEAEAAAKSQGTEGNRVLMTS